MVGERIDMGGAAGACESSRLRRFGGAVGGVVAQQAGDVRVWVVRGRERMGGVRTEREVKLISGQAKL